MLNFDPALLGPYFSYRDTTATIPPGASGLVVRANSQRVALILQAFTNAVFLRPIQNSALNTGINLLPAVGPTILDFATLGPLVGQEWYGFAGAGGTVYVFEVIYAPPAGD